MTQDRNEDRGTFERTGEQLGGAAGRTVGRGADVAADMIGSLLGSAMNTLSDWWSSPDACRAAQSFDQNRDRTCREHFEATGTSTSRDYDEVRPLYQFGHVAQQNPDFQGRRFDEVEPELQRTWDSGPRETHGDWPEIRGYVDFGYTQTDQEGRD